MSKTKKNNRSPGGCSSNTASSSSSSTSAESMQLIHNNLHHLSPSPSPPPPAQSPSLISDQVINSPLNNRMSTVRRLLTIAFLLLLICAVTLFSLHQILLIMQFETTVNKESKTSVSGELPPPQPQSSKQEYLQHPKPAPHPSPLLYHALLQKTASLNSLEQKRTFIRSMAREAWIAYTRLAWGHETLRPVTGEPYDCDCFISGPLVNGSSSITSGQTIVSAASSLWLMGLRHEYQQARNWIATQLPDPLIAHNKVGLYFAVGEYLGGLLSTYALTGDLIYLDKAVQTASTLKPAYSTELPDSGLLYSGIIKLNQTNQTSLPLAHDANDFLLVASQNLEYLYLLELTGNCEYAKRIADIRSHLWSIFESIQTQHNRQIESNYLLHFAKAFQLSASEDYEAYRFYNRSLAKLKSSLRRSRTGLLYVRELSHPQTTENRKTTFSGDFMETDSCCLASLIALGSKLKNGSILEKDLNLAASLVETCHEAARRTATGLSPARFYFDDRDDATNIYGDETQRFNLLGPELAEAYFILYRLTKNGKYQNYAWEMAQAIHRHCRTDSGAYSVIESVEEVPTDMIGKEDEDREREGGRRDLLNQQPTHFIGATLKYLYLTFSEAEVLPLEQWTFNSIGQPLPIKRTKVSSKCSKF